MTGTFVSLANIAPWRTEPSRPSTTVNCLIVTAYDDLAMQPGPHHRTRLDAARKGWLPPLHGTTTRSTTLPRRPPTPADGPTPPTNPTFDEVAIARAVAGTRVAST